jgi:Xaa-Pro aminopeptidase
MTTTDLPPDLTRDGCLARQERLRSHLDASGLDAALVANPDNVYYFTNFWAREIFHPIFYFPVSGPTLLCVPMEESEAWIADEQRVYPSNRLCTLDDDQPRLSIGAIQDKITSCKQVGCDDALRPWLLGDSGCEDLVGAVLKMRRTKDPDEVDVIRHCIKGCEAAFECAREVVQPGVPELEIHASMHRAATLAVGEPIGEFGNDFRANAAGGPPRLRPVEAGELMPLDVGVAVRGYHCDLCRTLCVGNNPTESQNLAARKCEEILDYVQDTVKPGTSCRKLFEDANGMLEGFNGWSFPHHLGHGVGLFPHEAPRLNPNWDDTIQAGDVIAVEPGLYGDELRAGVRIEDDFFVTNSGLERLSSHPRHL